jgi:hypothetical protein
MGGGHLSLPNKAAKNKRGLSLVDIRVIPKSLLVLTSMPAGILWVRVKMGPRISDTSVLDDEEL